jgi:predicted permease
MGRLARAKAGLRNLFRKEKVERELDAEVRAWVETVTEERIARGAAPAEARRTALAELGGAEQVKQAVRDIRAGAGIERVWQDVRFALRMLRKSPGFTAVVVLTLALGVGANTAIFSLVNAVLLQSIPVRNPGQLVVPQWVAHHWPHGSSSSFGDCGREHRGGDIYGCSISQSLFRELQGQTDLFSGVAAFAGTAELDLGGNGAASIARGELVSGEYFDTLGVPAAIGRTLEPADQQPGATAVAVLDYGYWERAFGGSAEVVGRTIRLNNVVFTIVGVADRGFTRLTPGKAVDLWVPLNQALPMGIPWVGKGRNPNPWWLASIARLRPGVTRKQAESAVNVLFRNEVMHGAKPSFKAEDDPRMTLLPAEKALEGFREDLGEPLLLLMAAVGMVLLIACANVAGLTLARSTARETEMAVRLALGASRWRIVQQLLTESVMLSLAGAAVGVLLAWAGARALAAFAMANAHDPFRIDARPDAVVLAFTIAVALVTGIGFGLAPAWRGARTRAAVEFNRSSSGVGAPSSVRVKGLPGLGGSLVVLQVALSMIVLTAAGLMLRTMEKLRSVDPGFDTRNLLLFGVDPAPAGYTPDRMTDFYQNLQKKLEALPGVVSASYSSGELLDGGLWTESGTRVLGETDKAPGDTQMMAVGPTFFETMRIPVLRGRGLSTADVETGKTGAVVNEAFVRQFVGKRDPIGLQFGGTEPGDVQWQILGVVANTKYRDLRDADGPTAYVPLRHDGAMFAVRTAGAPEGLMAAVRKTVSNLDENVPVIRMETQAETIDRLLFNERLITRLFAMFAALGLLLACIGLYGLLAYEVARRTQEIGVRTALGAQRASVLLLFLRRGLIVVLAGAAVGVPAAFLVSRLLESLLFGVKPGDPAIFTVMPALLIAVGMAACFLPALRATRVDPAIALRYE